MLYKVKSNTIESTDKVEFSRENLSEQDIEDWVEDKPKVLGEPLKIIARQLRIQEVGDRLDLLAIDKQGNLVIIELKSDVVKSDATLQAVKYASYLSDWKYEQIDRQMERYYNENNEEEYDSLEEIENFCEDDYEINDEQRIILAGREIRPRTNSVALWLRKEGVDIKITKLEPWKDGKDIYLYPRVIIPLPAEEEFHISVTDDKSQPWKRNGKEWHLNNRCSDDSADLLNSFIDLVEENFPEIEGPSWNQKFYITFKLNGANWIYVRTHSRNLRVQVNCNLDDFNIDEIANRLEITSLETDTDFKEKQLANQVKKWTPKSRVVFRLKADYEFEQEFADILEEMRDSFLSSLSQ